MLHNVSLISTIAAGFGLALVFGYLATRLKVPPLVGYLFAGILIGPFTPGYVADADLTAQLAEIGVMLLMLGVGLHFSLADLMAVRRIAIPGAILQIAVATALGAATSTFWRWSLGASLVFGLALSVASTVVLLRALESRGADRIAQWSNCGRVADRRRPRHGARAGAAASVGNAAQGRRGKCACCGGLQHLGDAWAHPGQGRRIPGADAGGREKAVPAVVVAGGTHRFA